MSHYLQRTAEGIRRIKYALLIFLQVTVVGAPSFMGVQKELKQWKKRVQ
jgi:hypothetical protein